MGADVAHDPFRTQVAKYTRHSTQKIQSTCKRCSIFALECHTLIQIHRQEYITKMLAANKWHHQTAELAWKRVHTHNRYPAYLGTETVEGTARALKGVHDIE